MKKNYLKIGVGLAALFFSAGMNAQTITESFDNFPSALSSGWVVKNVTTQPGVETWGQGINFTPHGGSGYAYCNYQSISGAGDLNNWLISPVRTFNNGDAIVFYTRTVDQPQYADNLQVRLSTNDTSTYVGTDSSMVGDFSTLLLEINPSLNLTSYPSVWTLYTATISGLAGPTSGRIAFRYYVPDGGPLGNNSSYIGLDDFFAGSGLQSDVMVSNPFAEYTLIPQTQLTPITLSAKLSNGPTNITDGTITAQVFQSPNFTTPIHAVTSAQTALAAGTDTTLDLGTFNLPGQGAFAVLYTSNCTGNQTSSNDTTVYFVTVTDRDYARDNGNPVTSFGIGAGPTGYIGSMFDITTATELDSVLFAHAPGSSSVGDSTKIIVFNVAGGVPTTAIGSSDTYIFSAADTLGLNVTVLKTNATGGGPLLLSPGTYFVATVEYQSMFGLVFCDGIFNNNTFYASWTGQQWAPIESFGSSFALTPIIRPILKNTTTGLANVNSVNNFSIYPNPAASFININTDNTMIGSTYKVYNQLGKVVLSGNVNQSKQQIDISNLANGIYFLEIGNGEKKAFSVQNN